MLTRLVPSLHTFEVEVTQDHIDQGVPFQGDCCPVALALIECIEDSFDEPFVLYVDRQVVSIWSTDTPRRRLAFNFLPDAAADFVQRFDSFHDQAVPVEERLEPFAFPIQFKRFSKGD